MFKFIFTTLFIVIAFAGCKPEASSASTETGPRTADELAAAVSEERLEKLSEIVRSLRDGDSNLAYPREDVFLAAVKKAYPAGSVRNDVLMDGWGNAFIYRRYADQRSYRLHSMGPNGTDENGTGDDAPIREGETIIE